MWSCLNSFGRRGRRGRSRGRSRDGAFPAVGGASTCTSPQCIKHAIVRIFFKPIQNVHLLSYSCIDISGQETHIFLAWMALAAKAAAFFLELLLVRPSFLCLSTIDGVWQHVGGPWSRRRDEWTILEPQICCFRNPYAKAKATSHASWNTKRPVKAQNKAQAKTSTFFLACFNTLPRCTRAVASSPRWKSDEGRPRTIVSLAASQESSGLCPGEMPKWACDCPKQAGFQSAGAAPWPRRFGGRPKAALASCRHRDGQSRGLACRWAGASSQGGVAAPTGRCWAVARTKPPGSGREVSIFYGFSIGSARSMVNRSIRSARSIGSARVFPLLPWARARSRAASTHSRPLGALRLWPSCSLTTWRDT